MSLIVPVADFKPIKPGIDLIFYFSPDNAPKDWPALLPLYEKAVQAGFDATLVPSSCVPEVKIMWNGKRGLGAGFSLVDRGTVRWLDLSFDMVIAKQRMKDSKAEMSKLKAYRA